MIAARLRKGFPLTKGEAKQRRSGRETGELGLMRRLAYAAHSALHGDFLTARILMMRNGSSYAKTLFDPNRELPTRGEETPLCTVGILVLRDAGGWTVEPLTCHVGDGYGDECDGFRYTTENRRSVKSARLYDLHKLRAAIARARAAAAVDRSEYFDNYSADAIEPLPWLRRLEPEVVE